MTSGRPSSIMAGNNTNNPAWAHSTPMPAGQVASPVRRLEGIDSGARTLASPGPPPGEDQPHRLMTDRGSLRGQRIGDLLDGAVLGAPVDHPVRQGDGLAWSFRPRLGRHEEAGPP